MFRLFRLMHPIDGELAVFVSYEDTLPDATREAWEQFQWAEHEGHLPEGHEEIDTHCRIEISGPFLFGPNIPLPPRTDEVTDNGDE